MPKETVQYPSTNGHTGTEVSVHWSKEAAFPHSELGGGGYVQLAATRHVWIPQPPPEPGALCSNTPAQHADHSHCSACADAVEHNEKQKRSGKPQMTRGDSTDAPPIGEFDPPSTVFSEPLTRSQINSLIRVLRRARDQAHGPDA